MRHQLLVLNRTVKAPTLRNCDRLFWAALCAMWSRWTKVLVIVQSQTVVRWHQVGFRLFWRWKSRPRTGRQPMDRELIDLIRRMWQANPNWGSPRIRAELAKLGLQVSAYRIPGLNTDVAIAGSVLPAQRSDYERRKRECCLSTSVFGSAEKPSGIPGWSFVTYTSSCSTIMRSTGNASASRIATRPFRMARITSMSCATKAGVPARSAHASSPRRYRT